MANFSEGTFVFSFLRSLFLILCLISVSAWQKPDDSHIQEHWLKGAEFKDQSAQQAVKVFYDYAFIQANLSQTSITVKMIVDNTLAPIEDVRVAAQGYDLKRSKEVIQKDADGKVTSTEDNKREVVFKIDDLEPNTIYQFSFSLSDPNGNSVSEWTEGLYAATSGEAKLDQVRASLVTVAFEEWDHYGKRGTTTVSGTRYGAGSGEAWCSEFYAWLGDHQLAGIAGSDWVGALKSYFAKYSSEFSGTVIPEKARAADYLSMWGTQHSGMFLEFEKTDDGNYLWTVEGNVGNRIRVMRRKFDTSSFRLGHIVEAQLKQQ